MAQASRGFEASELEAYTVIRVPEAFREQDAPGPKRLVVIGHQDRFAICIKATSKTQPYRNNPEMKESSVFYEVGQHPECFPEETAVQPDNQVPLNHAQLNEWYRRGVLEILGQLPRTPFEEDLLRAADGPRINSRKKERIIAMVTANRERQRS